jgi:hypothetical protein
MSTEAQTPPLVSHRIDEERSKTLFEVIKGVLRDIGKSSTFQIDD